MTGYVAPVPGQVITCEPGVQCVLAPNPSAMTGPGTNTYVLGEGSVAVIDPGPEDADHFLALCAALDGREVSHIFVTHSHLDHSPLARRLSDEFAAPVLAYGDTFAGRSPVMAKLAAAGMAGGGEGLDHAFQPDVKVSDGEMVAGDGWALAVHHTPGHLGNHIALAWNDAVFVGDMVMAWSTSLVSPPDGDMTDFLASCAKLRALDARVFYSGHGAPVTAPNDRIDALVAHRSARTEALLQVLANEGPLSVPALVRAIYTDVNPALYEAAGRNVFAHLVALYETGQVGATPTLSPEAVFALQQG